MMHGPLSSERGQASVELVALLPLVLIVGLAIMALLEARTAAARAAAAAQAGAVALLQDEEPRAAARDSLPPALREDARIAVAGRAVTVRVRPAPRLPFMAGLLDATATAHAGPEPPR